MKKENRPLQQMAVLGLLFSTQVWAAQVQIPASFSDVEVRFVKDKERELEDKDANLVLDDTARRLRVKSSERPLDVSYDDVQKVIVEINTFGKRAGFAATFVGMLGGLASPVARGSLLGTRL